jgi:hypothetical protein
MQVLNLILLEVWVTLVSTSHSHHHLIVGTDHIILTIVIWVMLRCWNSFTVTMILVIHHSRGHILLSKVFLLLIHWLSYNSFSVKVHGQVFEALNFKFKNFCAIKVFIIYRKLFLDFQLHKLRPS